jgi:hypothetical protein
MQSLNPGRKILTVYDKSFAKYGMVHNNFKTDLLLGYIKKNNILQKDLVYVADVPQMRNELALQLDPIMASIYGGFEVQVGVCYGNNDTLNGFEFHHGSEVYIVGADMIMMLGLAEDIEWADGTYNSSLTGFYFAPAGTVIELTGGCMHWVGSQFCKSEGISVIVSLLKGTNTAIDFKVGTSVKDRMLIAKNTWFIAHPECALAVNSGWHIGIKGENYKFNTL